MYEETAPRRTGVFRDVFLIVLGGFVLLSLPNWIPVIFGFPYVKAIYEFLVFVAIGLLIFRFLRFYGTEYKYELKDSVLVIRSVAGKRETVIGEFRLNETCKLIPLKEGETFLRENQLRPGKISYGVSDRKTAYLLIFPMQNGKKALIFQPSQKFVAILKQKVLDKPEKM